jgi:hypothetical protein
MNTRATGPFTTDQLDWGGDSTVSLFELHDAGFASRPHSGPGRMWSRSTWEVTAGDTLEVRLSTGLLGWLLRLTGDAGTGEYVGQATYLTDAIAVGQAPIQYPVRVRRVACVSAPPT